MPAFRRLRPAEERAFRPSVTAVPSNDAEEAEVYLGCLGLSSLAAAAPAEVPLRVSGAPAQEADRPS